MVRTGWEFTDLASRYPKMATSKGILGVSSIKFVEYRILGPAFLSSKWCGSGMVGESRDFWTSHVGGAALLRKLFDFHPCCPYNVNPKITNPQNQIKPLHLESWSYQVLSKPSHNSILGCPHQRKPSRGRLAGAGASRTSSWCTTSSVPRNVSGWFGRHNRVMPWYLPGLLGRDSVVGPIFGECINNDTEN